MRLAVVDVETTMILPGDRPRTLFWGAFVEGEGYRRFPTTAALDRWLGQRKDRLTLLHHHDFDPIQWIMDGFALTIRTVRGSRILRGTTHDGRHTWKNTLALFPSSLAEILRSCGLKKPDLGCLDHADVLARAKAGDPAAVRRHADLVLRRCRECRDTLRERNRADCEDAFTAFGIMDAKIADLTGVHPLDRGTAAGVAMAAAERELGKLPIDLAHHETYRGGRTEAYRIGACGTATAWDIASSYPASMALCPPRDRLLRLRVKVEESSTPGTPFYDASEHDKLIFPAGEFETYCYESNLALIEDAPGTRIKVRTLESHDVDLGWLRAAGGLASLWYTRRATAKREGDDALSFGLKIQLNSLYGQLGLRPDMTRAVTCDRLPNFDSLEYMEMPSGQFLAFAPGKRNPHKANYPFASYVTDNARARLYCGMRDIAADGGDVFYCDTDGILAAGGAPHGRGGNLGGWQKEGEADLTVGTVKDYVFGEKIKRKGGARSNIWTIREALTRGKVRLVTRDRLTEYDKRIVADDGSTTPRWSHGTAEA